MKKYVLGFVSGVAVSVIAKVIIDCLKNNNYEDDDFDEFDDDFDFSETENEGEAMGANA